MRTDRAEWTSWVAGAAAELRRSRRIRGAHRRTRRRIARAEAHLCLALAIAALPAGAGAAPPAFFNPLAPFGLAGVADGAELVALADIDGDGDLDAFLRSYYGVSFAANTGSATAPAFSAAVDEWFGIADLHETPVLADLDGDGDLDVFVPEAVTLRIFENTGSATAPAFAPAVEDDLGLPGGWSVHPRFADLDGDGDLDALSLHQNFNPYSHLVLFANAGSATEPEFTFPMRPFGLPYTAEGTGRLVDLDGDGDLDYVSTRAEDTFWFENTGTAGLPSFAGPVVDAFGLSFAYEIPRFVDLDGDGDMDVLSASGQDFVYRENTGTTNAPAFAAPATGPFGLANTSGFVPAAGDLDGDGDPDLLLGSANVTLYVANTGSATAPAFAVPVANPFGIPMVVPQRLPELEDLDGDGDLDLLLSRYGLSTLALENIGGTQAAAFAASQIGPPGLETVFGAPTFGDLDGDDDLDAIATAIDFGPVLFENLGTPDAPAFLSFVDPLGLSAGREAGPPALGDLDADGDLDAIADWTSDGGTSTRFRNTGSALAPAFAADGTIGPVFGGVSQLADVDGDGDLDLFTGHPSPTLFVENRGTPEQPALASPLDPFGSPRYGYDGLSIADLDGDGDLDAFATGYDEQTASYDPVFIENVGGPFRPEFAPALRKPFGLDSSYPRSSTLADLDGDGDLDVLTEGAYGFLLHANTGSATLPAFAPATAAPFGLPGIGSFDRPAVADLDGDGDPDVFAGDHPHLQYFENTGSAASPAFAAPAENPFGLTRAEEEKPYFAFGDLDGDGDLDALRGGYYGSIAFFENTGARTAPAFAPEVPFIQVPNNAEPALADLDGDGDLDLYAGFANGHAIELLNPTAEPVCPEVPAPDCAGAFAKASLTVDERKAGKESLRIEASRGPALAEAELGDPTVANGSAVAACLYDDAGELAARLIVDRAGESCGPRPCWSETRAPGIAYTDPAAAEDGVRTLRLDGGDTARFRLLARNAARKDQRALPRGIAEALSSAASITLQVHVSDGACASAELAPVKTKPGLLKAK